ncbi:hypothetical protein BU16DRAFT_579976 [Lophium mytilinum]|uniref:Uncharacterized protein n=1 Tax=Lophium mytilinum TaxID=390894 RepID=A0A6A6R650_9PEZI|nr:hypothetical protein BU16DRAFT_579976 [Lophium mytilinum]
MHQVTQNIAYIEGEGTEMWHRSSLFHVLAAFDQALKDVVVWGERASLRLGSDGSLTLPYMAREFERFFHRPTTDVEAFDQVKYVFDTIKDLTETLNRKASDVRIYCDDDRDSAGDRWTKVEDQEGDSPLNSELYREPEDRREDQAPDTGPFQQWEDKTNWIRMSRGSAGCQSSGKKRLAEVQSYQYTKDTHADFDTEENPRRVVMTLCDHAFDNTVVLFSDMKDMERDGWLVPRPTANDCVFFDLNDLEWVLTGTIFHEFTHMDQDKLRMDDVNVIIPDHPPLIVKWPDPYRITTSLQVYEYKHAIRNAETYTFLAAIAVFADWGYRHRDTEDIYPNSIRYDDNLERIGGEHYKRDLPASKVSRGRRSVPMGFQS